MLPLARPPRLLAFFVRFLGRVLTGISRVLSRFWRAPHPDIFTFFSILSCGVNSKLTSILKRYIKNRARVTRLYIGVHNSSASCICTPAITYLLL